MPIKFEVAELKNWINKQLERTDERADARFKDALCRSLDYVLENEQENYCVTDFKNWINQQLKSCDESIHDKHKEGFCITIEHVLYKTERYKGYTDNYWIKNGFREWMAAGEPDFPERYKYYYGPTAQQYNRHYF